MKRFHWLLIPAAALGLAACGTNDFQRAGTGAVAGAVAGEVIAEDPATGAAIGAVGGALSDDVRRSVRGY